MSKTSRNRVDDISLPPLGNVIQIKWSSAMDPIAPWRLVTNTNDAVGAMNRILVFAAIAETVTGLALLIVPSLVGQLLLGQPLAGVAIPVARMTGIALIALGIACWPATPLVGMLAYNAAVTLYFAYLGFVGEFAGVLLWPAAAVHALLSILLGRTWLAREIR